MTKQSGFKTNQLTNSILILPSITGSRTQYPIRLAYARYTRCKSQGQTMIKIVIDLGDTYMFGLKYIYINKMT